MARKLLSWFAATPFPLIIGLAVWALFTVGCSLPFADSDSDTVALSDEERQAILDSEIPVYGLGEAYQGLPLVRAITSRSDGGVPPEPPTDSVLLIYGDCTPTGGNGLDGPTCVPPLQIRTHGYCTRRPEMLSGGTESVRLRGATAIWLGGGGTPTLRLYTADATISIMAESRDTVLDVADKLYSMTPNAGIQTPNEDLGAPMAPC